MGANVNTRAVATREELTLALLELADRRDRDGDWQDASVCLLAAHALNIPDAKAKVNPASAEAGFPSKPAVDGLLAYQPTVYDLRAYQQQVVEWGDSTFDAGFTVPASVGVKEERNHRLLEEVLELVQACGCTKSEAQQIVNYVFDEKQPGQVAQEVGGVLTCLALLCQVYNISMASAADDELRAIQANAAKIRAKRNQKPVFVPKEETIYPNAKEVNFIFEYCANRARGYAHHAMWQGLTPYGWNAEMEKFGVGLAHRIADDLMREPAKVYFKVRDAKLGVKLVEDFALPCNVHLSLHASFHKGCNFYTLLDALQARAKETENAG